MTSNNIWAGYGYRFGFDPFESFLKSKQRQQTKVAIFIPISAEIRRKKLKETKSAMEPKLTEVSQHFDRFKAAFVRHDYDSCSNLLPQLKVSILFQNPNVSPYDSSVRYVTGVLACFLLFSRSRFDNVFLTGFRSLPPLFEDTPNAVHELTVARDIYEHAVLLSVKIEDQDAFERDFFQLKPYYTDARLGGGGLCVFSATSRDEIAGCSEKAYDYLSISNARQMLLFSSDQELLEYVKEEHPEWEITNGILYFQKVKESAPCKEIPSLQLINQTLSYARELERISRVASGSEIFEAMKK
ncbi:26S proteasome non-ATPase regulatory subunit 8-like A, partial [Cucurbita argyrosperma subsp. argyrosperma]